MKDFGFCRKQGDGSMGRKFILINLILLLILAAMGCSNADNGQNSAPLADKNTVLIQNYQFQPAEIIIKKGETVTWINQDTVQHTATCSTFDSGLLRKGESYKHKFDETGTFDYICTPHPYMKGIVRVE
ncbi:MAG: cupredoxin domain-containing protein [Christensenellales bacterium]